MADRGYVRTLLGSFPSAQKQALGEIFDYLLKNWRVGLPGHQEVAENMAWVQLNGTTSATPGSEVAIIHGLASAPRVAFPVLDLGTVGAQCVPLTTTRAADASRIYVSSSVASAPFTVFVEAR